MNVYNISWDYIAENFLLVALRNSFNQVLTKVLIKPISILHSDFMAYRDDSLYKVRHNSQKVYIQAMLNDKFDPLQRRIRVVNTVFRSPIYFYELAESREVFHYEPPEAVFYRELEEFAGDGVDFIVCVPPVLRPALLPAETAYTTRMRGLIDYFKLYSKNYNIVWVLLNE